MCWAGELSSGTVGINLARITLLPKSVHPLSPAPAASLWHLLALIHQRPKMGTGFHSQATHMLGACQNHTAEWEGMLFSSQLREYPEPPPKAVVDLALVSLSILFAVHCKGGCACFWQAPSCGFFNFRPRIKLSQRLCQHFASPPSLFL